MAKPGRLPREEQTLPPNIQKALAARASGSNWNEAAEVGKITPVNLRKWRKHPDAAGYLQQCIQHNIEDANSYIADHAPALAARLVELGLDRATRPYAAIQAISESFKRCLVRTSSELLSVNEELLFVVTSNSTELE